MFFSTCVMLSVITVFNVDSADNITQANVHGTQSWELLSSKTIAFPLGSVRYEGDHVYISRD